VAKPPAQCSASFQLARLPALLREVLQAGIPRRSSGMIPIGNVSLRKLEARATLLRFSGFIISLTLTASTFNNTPHFLPPSKHRLLPRGILRTVPA